MMLSALFFYLFAIMCVGSGFMVIAAKNPVHAVLFLILAFFWLAYGMMHREKPIIMTYTAWIIMDVMIVAGLLLF